MTDKPYVVKRGGMWLCLDGHYKYPRWTSSILKADKFSFGQAHCASAAFGGVVESVTSPLDAAAEAFATPGPWPPFSGAG